MLPIAAPACTSSSFFPTLRHRQRQRDTRQTFSSPPLPHSPPAAPGRDRGPVPFFLPLSLPLVDSYMNVSEQANGSGKEKAERRTHRLISWMHDPHQQLYLSGSRRKKGYQINPLP